MKLKKFGLIATVLFFTAVFGTTTATQGATLTVTAIGDTQIGAAGCADGCSLREAIDAAAISGDVIVFASPLFDTVQTIDINGQIFINKSLTITGRGANLTTVRNVAVNSRVVLINGGVTVNLSGMTFTGGNINSFQNGGGIFNAGVLRMTACAVSGNSLGGGLILLGGGIHNQGGTLTITNSTVSGNFINNAAQANGGGISSDSNGTLTIANSTVSGNFVNASNINNGGGILTTGGTATITNSTITNNSAGNGGGILVSLGTLRLRNTIVSGNFGGEVTAINGGNVINVNNYIGGDARLLPLGFYGGATRTHALQPNSPAINAGDNCVLMAFSCSDSTPHVALTTDQRGRTRAGQVDIGAFEYSATNLVVTNTNDNSAGSLRAAIASANLTAGDENISFDIPLTDTGCANGVCTITLLSGELSVNNETTAGTLAIQHPTNSGYRVTVSGNNNSRVFNLSNGANLTVRNLTVTGGRVAIGNIRRGGGIFVSPNASLFLFDTSISGNNITDENPCGGGIYISQNSLANITNSTISDNHISSGTGFILGAGMFIDGGAAIITNSTVSGNSATGGGSGIGGGIANEIGSLTLVNSTITNNTAGLQGGGILNSNGSTATAVNTIISGNISDIGSDFRGQPFNTETNNLIGGNALLAPLGFYGGQTMTHALLFGSTAINAGTGTNAPSTDQRGASRLGNVDIGAFELNNSINGGNYVAVLPTGTQNTAYSQLITANNGTFAYSITGGALPNGMNLNTNFAPNAVVALEGTPIQGGTFDFAITASDGTNSNVTNYRLQILAPTAAGVSVAGRVLVGKNGLQNAIVTMTDMNGNTRWYRTGSFGYFLFDDVEVGQTYVLQVQLKRFQFAPQVVTINEDLTELIFTAHE